MNLKRLIPNALTMGNLLGGAFVCWSAASGDEITNGLVAGVWLLAMFFDVLDGFVARKLGVDGPLGVQLDSLADMVTGGLAPAFVAYRLVCESGACEGVVLNVLPALLVVAAAYRLARYNVSASKGKKGGYFEGLPAPAAGMFWVGMMMWWGVAGIGDELQISIMRVTAGLGMLLIPLLMVLKRKFFGLKGWGDDSRIDKLRQMVALSFILLSLGTWFAWGNVYAAVPLCVLLYSGLAFIFAPKNNTT